MFDLIHGIKEETLANTVGIPRPHSSIPNDVMPTRIFSPFFFTANGPPVKQSLHD